MNSYIGSPLSARTPTATSLADPSPPWPQQFDRCLILLESFEFRLRVDDTRMYMAVTNVPWTYARTVHPCTVSQRGVGKKTKRETACLIARAANSVAEYFRDTRYVTGDPGFLHDRFKLDFFPRVARSRFLPFVCPRSA